MSAGRDHIEAVLDRLGSDQALTVYDGKVADDPTFPYVVLYADPGTSSRTSLAPVSDRVKTLFTVTAVGESRAQAGWAQARAEQLVLDKTLTIAGRQCDPISQESASALRRDDKTQPAVFYTVASYLLASIPA